jgi:hypothetical protein
MLLFDPVIASTNNPVADDIVPDISHDVELGVIYLALAVLPSYFSLDVMGLDCDSA